MSKPLWLVSFVLVVVGAVNWGLVGLTQFDLVAALFGAGSVPARIVYSLVGIAGVVLVLTQAAQFAAVDRPTAAAIR